MERVTTRKRADSLALKPTATMMQAPIPKTDTMARMKVILPCATAQPASFAMGVRACIENEAEKEKDEEDAAGQLIVRLLVVL